MKIQGCGVVLLLAACGGQTERPETPHEQESESYGTDDRNSVEDVDYDFDAPPEPTLGAATQNEKWWDAQGACPEGSGLYGGQPPQKDRFGCKTPQGKNVGRLTKFFPDGTKKEEGQFLDHFAEGVWTVWEEDGSKLTETNYVNGKKHGMETVWYPGGPIKSQRPYAEGKRHGVVFIWDENERKRTAVPYERGQKHGPEARWSVEGDLARVIRCEHGVEQDSGASQR